MSNVDVAPTQHFVENIESFPRNYENSSSMSHYGDENFYVNPSYPNQNQQASSSYENYGQQYSEPYGQEFHGRREFNSDYQRLENAAANSTLTPTAQEFRPKSDVSQGAIKKRPKDNYRNKHWEKRGNEQAGSHSRNEYETRRVRSSNAINEHSGHNSGLPEKSYNYGLEHDESSESLNFSNNKVGKSRSFYDNKNYYSRSYSRFNNYNSRPRGYQNERYNNTYDSYSNKTKNTNPNGDKNARQYKARDNYDKYGNYKHEQYYDKFEKLEKGKFNKNLKGKDSPTLNNTNWREATNTSQNDTKNYDKHRKTQNSTERQKKLDAASQRERLVEMIKQRNLECLVCCEKVKHTDKTWSCGQCYHILHLSCTVAWAKSSKLENGWRCPACQNVCSEVPKVYKCYCGKITEPKVEAGVIPHSCGDICLKKGRTCEHKCLILCHPGPCPDCNVMVAKSCGCGATEQTVKCTSDIEIVCDANCNKSLECGLHYCTLKCHVGVCNCCEETVKQECYCGKVGRKVPCTSEQKGCTRYVCGEICDKLLACGNHKCSKICHEGPCDTCSRSVGSIKTCPCGKSTLKEERTSCLDPIPCCDKICSKTLKCGQPSHPHICESPCHEGSCPPCPLTTLVRCRCGHMDKELPCQKLTSKADDARCEKKCTKKRLCGKHRCNQRCCIEIEHICPLPCNHQLSCGLHRCERTCHSGRCPPCMETSFEELFCECGGSVAYPPIPCGTKPPLCNNPCSRSRLCGHDANHSCHVGPCPPCTILCKKCCYGKHEERSAIPCHQNDFSCGRPCGKPLSCGRHKCIKPCHKDACGESCKQPCTIIRPLCGHPCSAPCHGPPCPETICKQSVPVTCQCGLMKATKSCVEVLEEYKNIEMAQILDKMVEKDQPVDISDIVSKNKKPSILKILDCTEECKVLERNRRLAIGLQIRNPDLSQKLTPRYSDFMRGWSKKDPHFCQRVHNKLTELVQLAKQSKQKSRSYSFESMNKDKRHFIHEYCEHFGCESAAYDSEPNRNVVATAIKDKSWLPSMSVLEVIQRENGHRKVPGPVLGKGVPAKSESVSLMLPSARTLRPSTPPGEFVDYFHDQPV